VFLLNICGKCLEYRTLQNALVSLPKTLDETYSRILRGIPAEHKQNATRLLQFLAFSERPLRVEEALDVIVVDIEGDQHFNPKYRMPDPQEITCYCPSLVVVVCIKERSYDENYKDEEDDEHFELQLAHFSVKEYLTSNRLDKDIAQSFQEIVAKASIAIVCLAYLLDLDLELPTREIREKFPLAQYCATYWMTNAAVAEGKNEKLQGLIREFFCHRERSYRNCYNLYRPDREMFADAPAPALYYASFGGLINAVKHLLSKGADVNAPGGLCGTPLQAASSRGCEKIVKLLLSKGADVNAPGGRHGTALQAASSGGHEKVVELLLSERHYNIGEYFRQTGKYIEAEKMYRQALELTKEVLGDDHPSTLDSMNNLAIVLEQQGKYAEAETLQRQTLERKKGGLGDDHPATLTNMNNLVEVFRQQDNSV
jgi:tetratricopeptide (TPR) repeat protein